MPTGGKLAESRKHLSASIFASAFRADLRCLNFPASG